MSKAIFAIGISVLLLSACAPAPDRSMDEIRNSKVDIKAVNIGGVPTRCVPWDKVNLRQSNSSELVGDLRDRFLTSDAEAAGVRVFTSGQDVSGYGSTVVYYTNSDISCLLFAETLGLQEYTAKAGLNPTIVTTGYVPAAPEKK